MLYGEITAVCFQIHTKQITILRGQNVEQPNVQPRGNCFKINDTKSGLLKSLWQLSHLTIVQCCTSL
jgi:hypothetical protein